VGAIWYSRARVKHIHDAPAGNNGVLGTLTLRAALALHAGYVNGYDVALTVYGCASWTMISPLTIAISGKDTNPQTAGVSY
jgi:hypothetical protein